MSEELDGIDDDEPDGAAAAPAKKGGKGKIIAIVAVVFVLLLGGGGAVYFLGFLDSFLKDTIGSKSATIELGAPVTHELPEIRADLKTGRCRSPFLRTTVAVQISSEDLARLQAVELRVLDEVRTYLRDHEREDLVGRAGNEMMRFDLTRIINTLIAPAKIQAIIFKDFVLQ